MLEILERVNQIACISNLNELLNNLMDFILEVYQPTAGTLFIRDPASGKLLVKVIRGKTDFLVERISLERNFANYAINEPQITLIEDVSNSSLKFTTTHPANFFAVRNAMAAPLIVNQQPVGIIQIYNFSPVSVEPMRLICGRMASEIRKSLFIEEQEAHVVRLKKLIDIIGQIGASLDREQILRLIIESARELLHTEACSLFLVDEASGDIVLRLASHLDQTFNPLVEQVRVPPGKGIIGHVVQTGETIMVDNAATDERHYTKIDDKSGFATRSILAVPFHTYTVSLGGERGEIKEHIIGGLEAINKLDSNFNEGDAQLLRTLASQAATVLEIARLYEETNELFMDVIQVMTAAIDAKDPYTEGHSQRVANISVEIASEASLPPDVVQQVRIGGLLHDVGKIGIPDSILVKTGKLTPQEYEEMKAHPSIGSKIMSQVRMLQNIVPALLQHHERLDGSGYPNGLSKHDISLIAQIVSISDVFDALTSDRPYRKALPTQEAIEYLRSAAGTHFEKNYVDAMIRAYKKGKIQTQREC